MRDSPVSEYAAPRKRLIAGCLGALAFLTSCSGGVTGAVSTAVEDSSSAIATARLALRQDTDGKLTRAAASTALDDALKELLASRDTVLKLSPGTDEARATVQETLTVLDACAAGLTTARDSVASDDGAPSREDGSRELASAADRLSGLTATEGGK
ncbi:hypothetical protein [Arthrobacter sp. 754]|uniref:hypothetical protein n=1 Tax=Arthrobacter sp. 754 TaxID=3156315 RepID=UPI003393CF8F